MSTLRPRHPESRYELVADASNERASEPPLRVIRRALRGRLRLLVSLALALSCIGAGAGYTLAPMAYRSTGLVLIEGALTPILYESQETQVPPMFEAYVSAQMAFLRSREVLDAAVDDPQMRTAGWPTGRGGVAALQSSLEIERGRREQIISVSVRHLDPNTAKIAVDTVLRVFRERASAPPGLTVPAKEKSLVSREAALEAQLHDLRREILDVSDQYGEQGINRMHTNAIEKLIAIDTKVAELQIARARRDGTAGGTAMDMDIEPAPKARTVARSMHLENELTARIAHRRSLRSQFGDRHPVVRKLDRQIESLHTQIELDAVELASLSQTLGASVPVPQAMPAAAGPPLEILEERYERMRADLREQASYLGEKRVMLTGLRERVLAVNNQLNDTRRRLDEIRVEARQQNLNRVTIAAFGDVPVLPASDRRSGLAAAGGMFGSVLAFALVLFVGLVDRRARFIDELERLADAPPLVGVLPRVDERDAMSVHRAGQSVHQLRNLLEINFEDAARCVCTITSSDRGEGKTTLALSLGGSLAAAGRRTLVIDADAVHFGLSRQLGLEGRPGLWEAIGPPSEASSQVHATARDNLWAMPIGSAQGLDAECLSSSKLIWLLDNLRKRYDAIVIDTGPILTSIEACLVAAVSDRVIMVTDRGQKLGRISAASARLRQVGAVCLGIVFNRASKSDIDLWDTAGVDVLAPALPLAGRTSQDQEPLARAA